MQPWVVVAKGVALMIYIYIIWHWIWLCGKLSQEEWKGKHNVPRRLYLSNTAPSLITQEEKVSAKQNIFAAHTTFAWRCLSCSYLNMSFYCILASIVSGSKSTINLIEEPLTQWVTYSSLFLKMYFSAFKGVIVMCLGMNFWVFLELLECVDLYLSSNFSVTTSSNGQSSH